MALRQGTRGVIEVKEHFMGFTSTTMGTTALPQGPNGVMYCSVQEGSFAHTVNEPGGVLAVTTDTADNDNCCLYIGPFKPIDGGVVFETRFKVADITTSAIFVGFQEEVHKTTPVMNLSFSGASLSYADTGCSIGLVHDKDATSGTADWRAGAGNDTVKALNADANGTRANNPPVNDKYDVVQVRIDPSGHGEVYLADDAGALRLVKRIEDAYTPANTDSGLAYAVLFIENRSHATNELKVDYMYARGYRDWTDT